MTLVRALRRAGRSWLAALVIAFAVVGCAGPVGPVGSETSSNEDEHVSSEPPSGLRSLVLGEGRTVAAAAATGGERVAVLTTLGLAVHDVDQPVRTIRRESPTSAVLAVSPSGGRAAILDDDAARLEVWDLDEESLVADFVVEAGGGPTYSLAFSGDDDVLHSTSDAVIRYTAGGEREQLVAAMGAGLLGPMSLSDDGRWLAARLQGTNEVFVVERDGAAMRRLLEVPDDAIVGGLVVAGSDTLIAEIMSMSDASDDVLARVDLSAVVGSDTLAVLSSMSAPFLASTEWTPIGDETIALITSSSLEVRRWSGGAVARADVGELGRATSIRPMNGRRVLTAHDAGVVRLWTDGAEAVSDLGDVGRDIRAIDAVDERHVLWVESNGVVRLVDVDGTERVIDRYAAGAVTSVVISPDQRVIVAARSTGDVVLHDAATGELVESLDHGGRSVDRVAIAPNSGAVVTGVGERLGHEAFDDTVTVWDLDSATRVAEHGGEGHPVAGCSFFRNLVKFSPDGSILVASSHDFSITLFRPGDLGVVRTLPAHAGAVLDVAFSPDGRTLATSSDDWSLRLWDLERDRQPVELEAELGGYWALAFAPDGSSIATLGATGIVRLIAPDDGRVLRTLDGAANWTSNLVFSSDGSLLAAGGKDDDVVVWDVAAGTVSQRFTGHADLVSTVDISSDGTTLVSGSADGTVRSHTLDP